MADTGKQSPLGVNALSSLLQSRGLYINPKVPRFVGISRTNEEYIWTWWKNNDPSGFFPAEPLESTVPGNTAGNDTGKIIEDTVLRLLTWAINEGFYRGKIDSQLYNNLIYLGSDINASITVTNSGWPTSSANPTAVLNRGNCTIPALGNAKPPTYQPYDPAGRWTSANSYAKLDPAPANTSWPYEGYTGQKQGASWFPYRKGATNDSITSWGYFRLHYLQAWGEFKYNDPIVTSPYNYYPPYSTASYPPKYKDFCTSYVSADAWKNYSNQAIYSMYNSQEFLRGAYSGMNDLISGDLAGINSAFNEFGEDLILLGKALNVKTISRFGYPSNLLINIIESNAMTTELALALESVEIFMSDIDDFVSGAVIPSVDQERKIYSAFLTIRGQNLEPICRVLNCRTFDSGGIIDDNAYLADLLSPQKVFKNSKRALFIPIYNNSTQNMLEAGSKLRIQLFPDGTSVNSELTSAAVTENVGELITEGQPPIITEELGPDLVVPQKGFNSTLESIIPRDDAIACTALSYAFQQITNIQQSDNENFAQVVKKLETLNFSYLTQVSGTNNYTPVNVPIAQKGHFITSGGSGPRGTYTMSDMFGNMSSLPYPWQTIYEKLRQIAYNPGTGNSIATDKPNAGLFYIYKQLFLALCWEPAVFYIAQWPIDLRNGCGTKYVDGACLNQYQKPEPYIVSEIGSKGLVGINPGMEIKSLGSTTQWTWNYIAGNPFVETPCKPDPPDPLPPGWTPPPDPPLDTYTVGNRIQIVRDPGTDACIGNGVLLKLFKDPIYPYFDSEEYVTEYPWRGYPFYDVNIKMPRRPTYTFSDELFCDRSITSWIVNTPTTPDQSNVSRDEVFPTRGLVNGGGYLRGNPSAAAPTEEAAQFGGPRTTVFPQYRNIGGAQAYVKRMGVFDTTAQSNEYGRFGRYTKFAINAPRIWYYRLKNINYPDGRTFPSNRYWASGKYGPDTGNDGPIRPGDPDLNIPPQREGIYSEASPVGAGYLSYSPPFTEIWWDLNADPDFLWGNCFLPNPDAQIPPWRLYIKTEKPPPQLCPVYIKEDNPELQATGTSLDGLNVEGDWYTMAGSRAASSPNAVVKENNNAWLDGRIPAAIRAYIAQANKEIKRIYDSRNVNNPNDPVNTLNTLYENCGTQLMIEQRTRYYALPPVPVPYDDFLNSWPSPLYTFVDSLPMLHQDTAPHMTSQTLDNISDFSGGSDTLNPIYDTTRYGVLGGQSTIAIGPQERNQQKLAVIGIPLNNNIENYIAPEERIVWTMNNTLQQATNNQSTPGGDYIITSWPGYVQPGGGTIAPIPQGIFVGTPTIGNTRRPGELSGTAGTPGPWPQVGTLVVVPSVGSGQQSFDQSIVQIISGPVRDDDPILIVDPFNPTIPGPGNRTSGRNPNTVINPVNSNTINFPINFGGRNSSGGTAAGGLGASGQFGLDAQDPTILTGIGYASIVPPNLDTLFTGTTTFPSSLTVDEAIAQVIACNCDCFIT